MTGIGTASEIARVNGRLKPCLVPSRSIEVNKISPAPLAAAVSAKATASMPVGLRPPWVKICHSPGATVLASIAQTMHWLPNRSAAVLRTSGLATAAELNETLSAPASKRLRTSSSVRTPPPTVSGIKHCSAVRRTRSNMVPRFSWVAWISRKHSSSAPAAS